MQVHQKINHDDLSIVLVNYKTPEVTKVCLELLEKVVDVTKVDVWVVDNDSNDQSTSYLIGLDWIRLIERKSTEPEVGFMAHGRALDMVLDRVQTQYLLLMHTDTLIYDVKILELLLEQISLHPKIAAVGCLEQVKRHPINTSWRVFSRAIKYYMRLAKRSLGFKTRDPRLFYEIYLKSFCTLWNANIIKQHALHFAMVERIPGYEIQDILRKLDFDFIAISPQKMFEYLDHIEAGTVSLVQGLGKQHKRVKNKQAILQKVQGKSLD